MEKNISLYSNSPTTMVLLLALSFSLPIFLLYFLLRKHTGSEKPLLPPGPRGLPLIGNLHQLDNTAPHRHLWQLSKTYGPFMSLRLGSVQTLVVSSAKMSKEVMKTHDLDFASRPSLLGQQKLSYNGLDLAFAPYSDYWREMRKICVIHLFNLKRVQSFRSIREDEVSRMINKISEFASESKVVNLSETVMTMTSSIICRVGFGKRYEDEGYERSRFHSLLNEAQAMMAVFFVTDYFPVMGWVDRVTGLLGRLQKTFRELDLFYQEIIDDHLDPKREKSESEEDITDVLLKLRNERSFSMDFTFDHIKALLMNIFVAGTDTSAAMLVWAMTALIKNPKVMKKVQEEVRNMIGKKDNVIDEDDLQKLPYLKAVVKESMRLDPVVPLLVPRETIQACNIDGYTIPSKTLVYINAWAIGRDPEAWENPEEFLPERFLGNLIDFKGQNFELVPFGAGRRGCPGIHMGVVTVELALANLLYSFEWELPAGMKKEDIDTNVIPGLATHKKIPLCLLPKIYGSGD